MTSTRKEPLPFQAMHAEREYFRAMHSALLQAPDMLRSDTVYTESGIRIDYDGTTYTVTTSDNQSIVRTENPLQTAAKYAEAIRKATKPKKRAYRKHSEADENHYLATNGTPTLLSQDDNADLFIHPTKSLDTETMNEARQAKDQMKLEAAATLQNEQEVARIKRDMKLAAAHNAAVDKESQAVKDNAALLVEAERLHKERAAKKPQQQKQQTLKPVKSTPTMKTVSLADIASQYDISQPNSKAENITTIYDITSVSLELATLQTINAQYDITSESKERVKLAQLSELFQTETETLDTETETVALDTETETVALDTETETETVTLDTETETETLEASHTPTIEPSKLARFAQSAAIGLATILVSLLVIV